MVECDDALTPDREIDKSSFGHDDDWVVRKFEYLSCLKGFFLHHYGALLVKNCLMIYGLCQKYSVGLIKLNNITETCDGSP